MLCCLAIVLVNVRNETAGLILVLLGVAAVVAIRMMGYMEYFAMDKVYGWLKDLTDVAGVTHERRSFLSIQLDADKARTVEELWAHVCHALEMLRFRLGGNGGGGRRRKIRGYALFFRTSIICHYLCRYTSGRGKAETL